MKPIVVKEPLSHVPFLIELRFKGTTLAKGTAFLYGLDGVEYLVTNWHNVTGRNPSTLNCIESSMIPNEMIMRLPYLEFADGNGTIEWRPSLLPLYLEEEEDTPETPIWFEHPNHGPKVDAVAIPVYFAGTSARPANDPRNNLRELDKRPGMDAFVLGYPAGLSAGGRLPVWKRASVASEPEIDLDQLPLFYIDTATRKGMSGSPVFFSDHGFWVPYDSSKPIRIGREFEFAGIYSGREGSDAFSAQLGFVWKESAIIEIIKGRVGGRSSFHYPPSQPSAGA